MVENYFWQFFDIMWLVLLLSQINAVCHCRFTVTAPRSQEAWSKNQRRRPLSLGVVWPSPLFTGTRRPCFRTDFGIRNQTLCANGHAVSRWSTHSYRVLPVTLLTEARSSKVVSAPVSKVSPEPAGQALRSVRTDSVFPSPARHNKRNTEFSSVQKQSQSSPFLTPTLLHRALGTSMEENLVL